MNTKGGQRNVLVGACYDSKYANVETLRKLVLLDCRYAWVDLPFSTCAARYQMLARQRGAAASGPTTRENAELVALLNTDSIPQYVWPAANPMCEWVTSHSDMFEGKSVLELGCGAGILGFTVAQHARQVVLTDCSPVSLALVLESVARNDYRNCDVAVLQWGREDQLAKIKLECSVDSFDIVIGSDIFYFSNSLKAGLETARSALLPQHDNDAVFLCGSVTRSDRMEFDLEQIPLREGFVLAELLVLDPFRLYIWKMSASQ
ncbi:Lysine methyltransferase/tRNA (Uracil-5-)-methyltransferase/Methyltransferase small domain [Leishmania utingensis]|uniref:Lysine methyltransferase/tRNA (Uracil-5-)-methyltransferase/Methyltransferase small domain n=1 Tax=Leishmania utingensis TaxID=653362 RepID=A0AAW3AI09_9TRYP